VKLLLLAAVFLLANHKTVDLLLVYGLQLLVVIVRVLANLYMGNFVRVGWCGVFSDYL
jgi:hypothetical protein